MYVIPSYNQSCLLRLRFCVQLLCSPRAFIRALHMSECSFLTFTICLLFQTVPQHTHKHTYILIVTHCLLQHRQVTQHIYTRILSVVTHCLLQHRKVPPPPTHLHTHRYSLLSPAKAGAPTHIHTYTLSASLLTACSSTGRSPPPTHTYILIVTRCSLQHRQVPQHTYTHTHSQRRYSLLTPAQERSPQHKLSVSSLTACSRTGRCPMRLSSSGISAGSRGPTSLISLTACTSSSTATSLRVQFIDDVCSSSSIQSGARQHAPAALQLRACVYE